MTQRWKLVPSTGALRAFVAVARHGSFSRAALELNLTQGAVSRHVRALEDQLGQRLFLRLPAQVALTEAGEAYFPEISAALERVAAATLGLLAFGASGGALDVAVLPTFGHRWLVPRLPVFREARPDITVNLVTHSRPSHLEQLGIDGGGPAVVVDFGEGSWPGLEGVRLMGETTAPVASPALLATVPQPLAPEHLARLNLLHLASRPTAWRDWFQASGRPELAPPGGQSFEQFLLVGQAAIAGLGVAIVPLFLFEEELASGKLVRVPGPAISGYRGYYALWSKRRPLNPRTRAFVDWLIREAQAFEADDS